MDARQRFNQTASGFDNTVASLKAYADGRTQEKLADARAWMGEKASMITGIKQEHTEALTQIALAAEQLPSAIGKVRKYMNRNATKQVEDDAAAAETPAEGSGGTVVDVPRKRVYDATADAPASEEGGLEPTRAATPPSELEPRDGGGTPGIEAQEADIGGEQPDLSLDDINFDVPEGGFGQASDLPAFSEETGHLIADRPLLKTLDLRRSSGFQQPWRDERGRTIEESSEVDDGTSEFTLPRSIMGTDDRTGVDTGGGGWMRQPDRTPVEPREAPVEPTAARPTTYTRVGEDEPKATADIDQESALLSNPKVSRSVDEDVAKDVGEGVAEGAGEAGEAAEIGGAVAELGGAAVGGEVLAAATAGGPLALAAAGIGLGLMDLLSPSENAPKPADLAPAKISLASQHQLTFASRDGISDAPSPGAF